MTVTRTLTTAIALATTGALAMPAQAQQEAATVDVQAAEFQQVVDAYAADEPGVAVIVTRGGEVIYTSGRGVADRESGAAITPDTVFRYASITKQFAAATVLQMVDEGLLSLGDPLSKFLPDFPNGEKITVLQLLNHTSGIKSYTGIPGWMVEANTARAYTTGELVAEFADQPPDFAPGAGFSYNNSAYILVGAVIEQVSGRPWYEEVDRRIARPLGLSTFGYREDESTVPAFAAGYTRGDDGPFGLSQAVHASVPGPAGALSGTVGDLAVWAHALHGGEVLSPESYALMTGTTAYGDGETSPFGLGLVNSDVRGAPGIGHSGGIFGFATDSIYLPEQDVFVAVFANSDAPSIAPSVTMRRLAAIAIGDPFPAFEEVAADMDALDPVFGVYELEDGTTRRFYARDGQLYTLREGAAESRIYAAGDNRFFYGPNSLTWFRIVEGADGVAMMEMHQNGAVEIERAVRTGPVPDSVSYRIPADRLASYVGSYESPIGVMVLAVGEDGQLTGKLGPQPALPLTALSDTEFAVQGVDARVVMVLEEQVVTGLMIRQGGQEIAFERLPEAD